MALVGEGVRRQAGELRDALGPGWETLEHPEARRNQLQASPMAVGMPSALHWAREMPALQLLQLPGAGTEGLDPERLPDGCVVCNVYEHEGSVAEYVFACLQHLTAGWLPEADAALRLGRWAYLDRTGHPPRASLCGKRLGVLGFGHIGRRCAEIAQAMDMKVLVHTRSAPADEERAQRWPRVEFVVSVAALAEASDYLVVACPLTDETRGLVDAEALRALGPEGILVNVARGDVVEERALYEALAGRRIGGAVLDVWYRYPGTGDDVLTGSEFPFEELDNVVVTPHLAAHTEYMVWKRWEFIAANLARFAAGEKPRNLVWQK